MATVTSKPQPKSQAKADRKPSKGELGQALTAIRKPLSQAWKDIDGGQGPKAYIKSVEAAIKAANAAIELARKAA